jgi:hypothetical protein
MLKRQLELDVANPSAVDSISFRELMREGFERGYIIDPEEWFVFREHRNTVSQIYNADKAKIVFQSAENLKSVALALYDKLIEKNKP